MAKEILHWKRGDFMRAFFTHKRYEEAARRAEDELKYFEMGEPSEAFYPPNLRRAAKTNGKANKSAVEIASKEDMENRKREQLERAAADLYIAGHPGNLPFPMRNFIARNRKQILELLGER